MQTSAQWIADAVSGRLVGADVAVTGPVVTDSREAQAGSLYVARRGESADGHAFVAGAATRGAVAVIVEHEVDEAVAQIVVTDSTEALGALARAHVEALRGHGTLDVSVDAADRAHFTLVTSAGSADISLKIVGRHHVANALAAAAGALTLGVDLATVARVLSSAHALSPHRMDVHELVVEGRELTLIDDSYNANLDSMRAGIAALASIGQGRPTVAVLGEMLELGEDSRSLHEQVGAMIEEAGVDALVGLGANAHYYLEGASGVPHREVASDPSDAARLALQFAGDGAVVLVKGSFGSHSWQVADILREKGMTR